MSALSKSEISTLLHARQWTVAALAERWGLSRRYVTSRIANQGRGSLWDDAFRGLPMGPGFYRRRPSTASADTVSALQVGSLVASEADMDTFGYGSRGIVVAVLGTAEWKVVWDGGSVMTIDQDCLNDWVVDLGLRIKNWELLEKQSPEGRIDVAKMINLYG